MSMYVRLTNNNYEMRKLSMQMYVIQFSKLNRDDD